MMKKCCTCKKEIPADLRVGRQAGCPWCGADLHCCLNCAFYEPGAYNDCRENQAERILDKNRSNFCDYFRFRESVTDADQPSVKAKDRLAALFKR